MYLILYLSCMVVYAMGVDYHPSGFFDPTDVTKVTWAHGVNSNKQLSENLGNSLIRMLEADIVMGTLSGSYDTTPIPIMAHPPVNVSDLSLASFVDKVIEYNKDRPLTDRKGIKLDFKELEAAEKGLPHINDKDPTELEFPIWINADILQGPVNASESKVDGKALIQLQMTNVPNGTLSIGWTTRFGRQSNGEIIRNGGYNQEQVDEMAALLKETLASGSKAEITFPLRAGLALNSVDNIKRLLDESNIHDTSLSVTLWEGSDDPPIEQSQLDQFTEAINKSRVFVDLPHSFGKSGGNLSACQGMANIVAAAFTVIMFVMIYK